MWIQNKLVKGTTTKVTAFLDSELSYVIARNTGIAHQGYNLDINAERYNVFYLRFDVVGSFEKDKVRGPFNNVGEDICWHFHGHIESWDVYPCPN